MSEPPYLIEIANYASFLADLPFISHKQRNAAIAHILDAEARARKILDESFGIEGQAWRFDEMDKDRICVIFWDAKLAIRFKLSWSS